MAAEAAGAAASAAAVAAGVARFVVARFVVASGIVEAPGIAVASGTAEERSLEGASWVLRPVMAPATMVAAILAVAIVIRRTKIAVEAVTMVAAATMAETATTAAAVTMVADCIVAPQW